MANARALLVLLALLWVTPLAAAFGHEGNLPGAGPEDRHARTLHIVQYHPYPDPSGDPWGFAGGTTNGSRLGYMESQYHSYWYPTAVFDGVAKLEGALAFQETYEAYLASYLARRQIDSVLRASVGGWWTDEVAAFEVDLAAKRSFLSENVTLRVMLVEDEIPYDGGNGVKVHRFTARAVAHDERVEFAGNGTARVQGMTRLNASWSTEKLAWVVSVHNRDPNSAEFKPDEVLQAATYRFGQQGPTIQYSRGVLLETLTATWCAACVYGDGVVDTLANEYGHASSRYLAQDWAYLRPLRVPVLAVSAALGLFAAGAWVARGRRGGQAP